MFKRRYPGCYPAIIGAPMWQRRVGFWLADFGNWLAGWPWGEDHYIRGVRDGYGDKATATKNEKLNFTTEEAGSHD